jgi:phosphopantothenoylcysteine decarboxylase/phosphopantothenate--cysteine ligase
MVLEPEVGVLAGGDAGAGRLPDPEVIATLCQRILDGYHGDLSGLSVVVTAGGTREPLDPVRVVTNRSSGHQGYAVAEVAARRGATVTLVTTASRPLALDVARAITVVPVSTASDMADAVFTRAATADVVVMAAAVADFTFTPSAEKIKKDQGVPTLTPVPSVDILTELVARRRPGQTIVGFAAETNDVLANAQAKLARKGVDLLVVNDVAAPEVGFEHPTNDVHLLTPDGGVSHVSLRSKEEVAMAILTKVFDVRR